jgi:hypothetical protein
MPGHDLDFQNANSLTRLLQQRHHRCGFSELRRKKEAHVLVSCVLGRNRNVTRVAHRLSALAYFYANCAHAFYTSAHLLSADTTSTF